MGSSNRHNLESALILILLLGTFGCSKKSGSPSAPPLNVTPIDPGDDTDEARRRCRIPVRFTNASAHEDALEALVQARVNRRERPTTMCVAAKSSPLKSFGASLRFEYEDNYGLRWVTFRKRDLIHSNQSNNKFRIIYLDEYGYVEINTSRSSGSQRYTGVARLANIDPYASYLNEIEDFLDLIKRTCSESPAKCLNPIFIPDSTSYRPPTEAEILQRANEAFQGKHGAEVHTLGTVTFDSDDIESTLF